MSSQTKQLLINSLVLIGIALVFGVYLWVSGKWAIVLTHITTMNRFWLSAAVVCMVVYLGLEVASLSVTLKLSQIKISLGRLVSTTMVGQFFANITPLASGGQPAQAASLAATGVPLGSAASALLTKFAVYQATLTLYAAAMLFQELEFFKQTYGNLALIALLGFSIHFIVFVGLVSAGLFPRFLERLSYVLINLGARIKVVKDPTSKKLAIKHEIRSFKRSFRQIRHQKAELALISVITVLQLTVYYLVPYCVIRALGINVESVFILIAAAAFVLLIASSVPLPGGSGGAEGSFAVFLGFFIGNADITVVALLMWRLISFYLPTLLGAPFVGALKRLEKKQGRAA